MNPHPIKTQGMATSAMSSPGLYSPSHHSSPSRLYPASSSGTPAGSPFLHPLQMHKVRE